LPHDRLDSIELVSLMGLCDDMRFGH